jgi:hypothetical protein
LHLFPFSFFLFSFSFSFSFFFFFFSFMRAVLGGLKMEFFNYVKIRVHTRIYVRKKRFYVYIKIRYLWMSSRNCRQHISGRSEYYLEKSTLKLASRRGLAAEWAFLSISLCFDFIWQRTALES